MNTLKKIGEFGIIRQIKNKIAKSKRVKIGIGDDAALVSNPSVSTLITTDLLVEGVDFDFKTTSPEAVGHKALAVNLSDIAAMGGVPTFAVIGLSFPSQTPLRAIQKFQNGLLGTAKRYGVEIVGGDLSKAPRWMVSVALLGYPSSKRVATRSGAKPGDLIYVTGALGGSLLGKHVRFEPRIEEGKWLSHFGVSSMIDISDGFLQDLEHVLDQSRVGADVELQAIPISRAARNLSRGRPYQSLLRALSDGEDFELLFTVAKSKASALERRWKKKFSVPLTQVGTINYRRGAVRYLRNGKKISFQPDKKGFSHFND